MAAEPARTPILRVILYEANLSLGQLGSLLQSVQTTVRGTATAINRSPPYGSIRASALRVGSLEFLVEVVGWGANLAQPVAIQVLSAFDHLSDGVVVVEVVRRLLSKVRSDKRRKPPAGPQLVIAREFGVDVFGFRPRNAEELIVELSRELQADPNRVRAAVSAVEAARRSSRIITQSGGGMVSDPERQRAIRIGRR